jgi:hypothetical protein
LSLEENDAASAQILADIGVALRAVGEEGRFFILYILFEGQHRSFTHNENPWRFTMKFLRDKPSGFNDEDSLKPLRLLN